MVHSILNGIVSMPWVYDLVQNVVGLQTIQHHLRERADFLLNSGATVLDVGGGTGLASKLWGKETHYFCLDIDPTKITGFMEKGGAGAILSDAACMGIRSNSVDVALCIFVLHHVPEEAVDKMFREIHRVLKPRGHLLLLDPLWPPRTFTSRMLWRCDRGSYPRTADEISGLVNRRFKKVSSETFSVYHSYLLSIARKEEMEANQ